MTGEAIAALEPELAGRFSEALYFAGEGHISIRAPRWRRWPQRLAELRRADPLRHAGSSAAQCRRATLRSDCTGLAAAACAAELRGVKGEMLLLQSAGASRCTRPVRVLHPRLPVYVVPRGGGLFMVGAHHDRER